MQKWWRNKMGNPNNNQTGSLSTDDQRYKKNKRPEAFVEEMLE